jgi:hypothetical protein
MLETLGLSEKMAKALLDNKDATYALIKEVAANTN